MVDFSSWKLNHHLSKFTIYFLNFVFFWMQIQYSLNNQIFKSLFIFCIINKYGNIYDIRRNVNIHKYCFFITLLSLVQHVTRAWQHTYLRKLLIQDWRTRGLFWFMRKSSSKLLITFINWRQLVLARCKTRYLLNCSNIQQQHRLRF